MNNRKLLSVSLTILLAVLMVALAAPAVSAQDQGQGNVTVSLDPADGEVTNSSDVQTYEIVVTDADNGIGAYELNVSVGDTGVAEIADYSLTADGANVDGPYDNSSISADGSTLTLEAALGNASHDASATDGESFAIATVDVTPTGQAGTSTSVDVESVEAGFEIAEPTVGQGENPPADDFYDAELSSGSFTFAEEPEIIAKLQPADAVGAPGGNASFTLVLENVADNPRDVRGFEVDLESSDSSVVEFMQSSDAYNFLGFAGGDSPDTTSVNVTEKNGDNVAAPNSGPVVKFKASYLQSEATVQPGEELAVVELQAGIETQDIGPSADISVPRSLTFDPTGAEIPTDSESATVTSTFPMSLDFNDQEVQPGATVIVENVDPAGEQAAVVVTYENDAGDLVVAGLTTVSEARDSVGVAIEDLGGFSENAEGDLTGDHTAHILPASQLSQEYTPGDVVSAQTAGAIIDAETATVTDPAIPDLDGLDIVITEGLTIGGSYPLNQNSMFGAAGSIYGESGLPLPSDAAEEDQRFAPIASGQHVGLGGLPIQDEVYQWLDVNTTTYPGAVADGTLLDYQTGAPTQTVAVSFDGTEESPVTLDYSEALSHGLSIASANVDEMENIESDEFDLTFEAGQIVISFDEAAVGPESPTIQFSLVWEAADPVEGLSVDEPNGIDYETDHRLIAPDADQARDNFVTFEAGATGISYADASLGNFLGQPEGETDLESFIDVEGAANGAANPGSFLTWQGQTVTFETAAPRDTIEIYNVAVDEDGNYTLGEQVSSEQVGFADTAPGQVANLNTNNLSTGQYFVTFGADKSEAVVLDVRPLSLSADSDNVLEFGDRNDPFEVNVESQDTTGGDIETWFVKSDSYNNASQVIHVERNELTGEGDRSVEVIPSVDLDGPGEYTALTLHTESGVTTTTSFTFEDQPLPTREVADDVSITSPGLDAPGVPGRFDRGDIIPIELELEGGNVGTITFGDAEDQNVEITATVYDPTYTEEDVQNNADTTVTLYLSTYHIGQGYVEDDSVDNLVPNRPSWIAPGDWDNRNHGFFTAPADAGSALLPAQFLDREHNVFANSTIDIFGGSQGGAVLSQIPGYDFHSAADTLPYTLIGEDRDDQRTDVNFVSIEQRSTEDFRFWKAPGVGDNALEVGDALNTTTDDIEDLVEAGRITELETTTVTETDANGNEYERRVFEDQIAEDDFLIVQAQSTGLEGVMLEAVLKDGDFDNDGDIADNLQEYLNTVLGTSTDEVITDEFTEAMSTTLPRPGFDDTLLDFGVPVTENRTSFAQRLEEPEPNEELVVDTPVDPDFEIEDVIADLNADGTLSDYYIPYQFDRDLPVQTGVNTLTPSLTFDLADNANPGRNITLKPNGGNQPSVPDSVNPLLSPPGDGETFVDELDYNQALVSIDDVHTGAGNSELQVPRTEYTISGTSTMAPGTLVDIRALSETSEATPFLKTASAIELTPIEGSGLSAWEATFDFSETRDDVEIVGGTVFETDITRTGAGDVLGGDDIAGVVLDDAAVQDFVVNDQRSDGDVVQVSAFQSNRAAEITVQNANGTVLGTSEELAADTVHEQFNIVLDEPISSNQEVTLVAEFVRPDPAQFNDTVLAQETAEVLVEDETEAFFSVGDLDPQSVTGEPGDSVDVSVTVENLGDLEATQDIVLEVSGLGEVGSESLTLAGGESDTVSFTVDTSGVDPGQYTHTVSSDDSSQSGAIVLEAPPEPPEPAEFSIISISPDEATVVQGDELVVDATVQNVGEEEATQDVLLNVSGLGQVGSQSLTLAGGEAGSVSFTVDTSDVDAGDYTHTVATDDDSVEGSLTINEPEPADDQMNETDDEQDDGGDGSGAGFGVVVAALALLGAALLAMRRQVE